MAAATKSWSTLSSSQNVPIATPTNSTAIHISGSFGAGVCGTITNPATPVLSHGVNVNLQVSGDGTNYYTVDTFVIPVTASSTFYFWFNKVPSDAAWIQLNYAANTGASVTATAIMVYCTGYS